MSIRKDNFVEMFLEKFAPDLTEKELKSKHCYPPNGYLWNVCELNLIPAYKGIDAMREYDNADKDGALEFQYDNGFMGDKVAIDLTDEYSASDKIEKSGIIEFYVIGRDFSWCYIVTHEREACGPYFIKNNHNAI